MGRALCLLLCAAVAGVVPGRAAAPPAEVELSVLSYNVHGPSWVVAQDDPARRSRAIGERLAGYDVVALQEDFEYHDAITASLRGHARVRGSGLRPDPRLWLGRAMLLPAWLLLPWFSLPYGDGLSTLLRAPLEPAAVAREAYEVCEGWAGGRWDCWASKGFLRVRIEIGGLGALDVYNTHLDSGSGPGAVAARRAQLDQLAAAIEKESQDVAVILAGDLNASYDRPADEALLGVLRWRLGLEDSGAGAVHPAWRELDHILFRSGGTVSLEVVAAGEDGSFVLGPRALSDHPAIFARFRARPAAAPPRSGARR